MKTMRNEYRDLKKENDLIFSTLAEYDRDTITEIISVADNTRGIGYEIELIRKDLIAMAAQAEARRDYLPSVIGDVEVFKRNLLASMPRPKLADYMADSLVWLCTFALASPAGEGKASPDGSAPSGDAFISPSHPARAVFRQARCGGGCARQAALPVPRRTG